MKKQLWSIILFVIIFCGCKKKTVYTAIVGAMPEEIEVISQELEHATIHYIQNIPFIEGELQGEPVVILKCGVGKVNAAISTTLLIDHYSPEKIIFTGIAGAIASQLKPEDIVIGTKFIQHDLGTQKKNLFKVWAAPNIATGEEHPVFIQSDEQLVKKSVSILKGQPNIYWGNIATGDQFIADSAKKEYLFKHYHALAVDMESAAIAQVCLQFKTPFIIIRSISDHANDNAETTYFFNKKKAAHKTLDIIKQMITTEVE